MEVSISLFQLPLNETNEIRKGLIPISDFLEKHTDLTVVDYFYLCILNNDELKECRKQFIHHTTETSEKSLSEKNTDIIIQCKKIIKNFCKSASKNTIIENNTNFTTDIENLGLADIDEDKIFEYRINKLLELIFKAKYDEKIERERYKIEWSAEEEEEEEDKIKRKQRESEKLIKLMNFLIENRCRNNHNLNPIEEIAKYNYVALYTPIDNIIDNITDNNVINVNFDNLINNAKTLYESGVKNKLEKLPKTLFESIFTYIFHFYKLGYKNNIRKFGLAHISEHNPLVTNHKALTEYTLYQNTMDHITEHQLRNVDDVFKTKTGFKKYTSEFIKQEKKLYFYNPGLDNLKTFIDVISLITKNNITANQFLDIMHYIIETNESDFDNNFKNKFKNIIINDNKQKNKNSIKNAIKTLKKLYKENSNTIENFIDITNKAKKSLNAHREGQIYLAKHSKKDITETMVRQELEEKKLKLKEQSKEEQSKEEQSKEEQSKEEEKETNTINILSNNENNEKDELIINQINLDEKYEKLINSRKNNKSTFGLAREAGLVTLESQKELKNKLLEHLNTANSTFDLENKPILLDKILLKNIQ